MDYPVLIYQDEDQQFIGEVPTLPGVHSFGANLAELEVRLKEAIELYLDVKKSQELYSYKPQKYFFHSLHINNAQIKSTNSKKTLEMVA